MPKWVQQQFRDRGVQIDHEAARALVELVGENAQELATEVDKLTTWAAGELISGARGCRARPCEGRNAAVRPDRLVGTPGRSGRAHRQRAARRALGRRRARRLAAHGRSSDEPRRPRARVPRARRQGVPPAAAAERLKRNRFYVQKLYEQARNYTPEELGSAVVRLADLDLALKGGSKLQASSSSPAR